MALGVEEHLRRAARVRGAVEHGLGVRPRDEGQRRPDVGRLTVRGVAGAVSRTAWVTACLLVGVADLRPRLPSPENVGTAAASAPTSSIHAGMKIVHVATWARFRSTALARGRWSGWLRPWHAASLSMSTARMTGSCGAASPTTSSRRVARSSAPTAGSWPGSRRDATVRLWDADSGEQLFRAGSLCPVGLLRADLLPSARADLLCGSGARVFCQRPVRVFGRARAGHPVGARADLLSAPLSAPVNPVSAPVRFCLVPVSIFCRLPMRIFCRCRCGSPVGAGADLLSRWGAPAQAWPPARPRRGSIRPTPRRAQNAQSVARGRGSGSVCREGRSWPMPCGAEETRMVPAGCSISSSSRPASFMATPSEPSTLIWPSV